MQRPPFAPAVSLLALLLAIACLAAQAPVAAAQAGDTSVEGCIGCHALGEPAPVGRIESVVDLHYTDLDPKGPASASGYRQWNILVTSVDVTGSTTIVEFTVTDENGAEVPNVFASDGTLVVAQLALGVDPSDPDTSGDPTEWRRLVSENFTKDDGTPNGSFDPAPPDSGHYRYTALFDPTSVPISPGETLRAAIQLSESDIPAGNGWCDFDADLSTANDCTSPVSITRDIVQTSTCNGCHGVTSDTKLSFHNGGRTELEYCVVCHTPDRNADTGMTTLAHKIHYGSQLTQEWRGGRYDHVNFTRDIDDCASCHARGGVDEDNWKTEPNRESCGSCHDDVDFDTGTNHGGGGQQLNNRFCSTCHPPEGPVTPGLLPVATVHQGLARAEEAARYRGLGDGFAIESAAFDRVAQTLTVRYSVTRDGIKMNLASDPEWENGGSLALQVAWSAEEYTNEGSGSTPAPAQPVRFSALDIGNTVSELENGSYETVIDVKGFGFGTVTVALEGHPNADLLGDGVYSRIPVRSVFEHVSFEPRSPLRPRREVIDIAKCNACHDSAGVGLAFHGDNRSAEMQVCVLCHNPDATDIQQRPADPGETPDGKREESIDMKRMVHQIHMGEDLDEPVVLYGFGGRPHDYDEVSFIGNNANCLTCHRPGTYSTDDAWQTLPSTVDTGADVTVPSDDLNISPVTAVCSSCHDTTRAKDHMIANGGTFGALDSDILVPVPEPRALALALAALGTLVPLARRRLPPVARRRLGPHSRS